MEAYEAIPCILAAGRWDLSKPGCSEQCELLNTLICSTEIQCCRCFFH
jgi:hypothetical protein